MTDIDIDPILSLEELRRDHLRMSPSAFRAIRPTLPVISIGLRRKGVLLSEFRRWLDARRLARPEDQR